MHVFPGLNYFNGGVNNFWHQQYTDSFLSLIDKSRARIKLITGAHVHRSEWRAPKSVYLKQKLPMLVSQSVTPVYLNNPGYSVV